MIVIDDDLWSPIGDPTRRRMLDQLLLDGAGTATSLSEHLPVTRQAVSKHLDMLDHAGLVHATAIGREPVELMSRCSTKWATFLMSLKQLVETGTGGPHPQDIRISYWH